MISKTRLTPNNSLIFICTVMGLSFEDKHQTTNSRKQ